LLTRQLDENDHVSIVVYAGAAGMVLPETSGSDKATILDALNRLQAGGSTHGSAGIRLAYETAAENFIEGGVNRVILCTDGDFNVGVTSQGDLTRLIQEKAKSKIFLSVLGFGTGNYKDSTMEMLADKGNGNYAYIDSLNEGRKVLVEQMSGTLVTIAKDVKIQIEFNPAQVNSYRLIGYENRLLAKEDFNNDKKDAGEIGAGHTVTALYEIVPAGMTPDDSTDQTPAVDPLKYQKPSASAAASDRDELLTLKLRYKKPEGDTSRLLTTVVKDSDKSYARASTDFKFAAAVAEFGMILRDSPYKGDATLRDVLKHAQSGLGDDPEGYRTEFLTLVEQAQRLAGNKND
jgi:Ca-activated chloride channel family protein